jgi:hypothetical protein
LLRLHRVIPTAGKLLQGKNPDDVEQQQQHGCTPLSCARKGWIWAIIVSAVLLGVSACGTEYIQGTQTLQR